MAKKLNQRQPLRMIVSLVLGALAMAQSPAPNAGHAWANYHWERSQNPVKLTLGDNLTQSHWSMHLLYAESDWDDGAASTEYADVLNLDILPGAADPKRCSPSTGKIEICNDRYGNRGWLGIASIFINGDHIVAASVKVNDSYHDFQPYDSYAWRQFVMCQEVGHVFGLGHQDENFNNPNLGSCMDYTSDPGPNMHPDPHDFAQLAAIYTSLDGGAGGAPPGDGGSCRGGPKKCGARGALEGFPDLDLGGPRQWGRLISAHGPQETFELDLGQGRKVITHVLWTQARARGNHNDH